MLKPRHEQYNHDKEDDSDDFDYAEGRMAAFMMLMLSYRGQKEAFEHNPMLVGKI